MALTAPAARSRARTRTRRAGAVALVLSAVCLTAACSEDGPPADPKEPATPTSSAPPKDPAVAEAEAAAWDAYQGMVDAKVKATTKGSLKDSDIGTYASEEALAGVKEEIFVNLQNDIVTEGEPKVAKKRTSVDLDKTPHRAELTVCFDNATLTPINKKTGKSVAAPGQKQRYIVNASLRTIGERWVVIKAQADREQTC